MRRNSDLDGFREPVGEFDLSDEEQMVKNARDRVGGDEIDEGLFRALNLGMAVQQFVNGKADPATCKTVGRFIVKSAYEEIEQCQDQWAMADDPWSEEVKALHTKARGLRLMLKWLEEAIEYGAEAERILIERDEAQP